MNITPLEMYLITRLGAINGALITGVIVGTFASVCLGAVYLFSYIDQAEYETSHSQYSNSETKTNLMKKRIVILNRKLFKTVAITTAALWALFIAVPTAKQLAAIYVIPAIVNSEVLQEKIPETMNGIFSLAEAWMKELEPKENAK